MALGPSALGVRGRYEVEDFFPEGTPERATFERVRASFGRDDRAALVVVEFPRPLDVDGFAALDALTRRLEGREDLEEVLSPASARLVARGGPDRRPRLERAIPPEGPTPGRVAELLSVLTRPPYVGSLLSADARVAVVACVLRDDRTDHAHRERLLADLEAETARPEWSALRFRLAGYPLHRVLLARLVTAETRRLYPLVLVAMGVVLALAFRSPVGVAAPLLVMALSAVWVTGLMGLLGLPPNILAPAVYVTVAVVGVTDPVHLLARHRELLRGGEGAARAAGQASRELLTPCLWTSLTTALGFASLVATRIPMVVHFGLQVALGVMGAWVVSFLVVPALMALWPARPPARAAAPGALASALATSARWTVGRPRRVALGFLVVFAGGSAGVVRLRVNSPLLADLDATHPIRETNRFLEERLAGVIPLDVLVEPPAGTAHDPMAPYRAERIERVARLTERLRALPEVLQATSVADSVRQLAAVLEGVPEREANGLVPAALLLAHEEVRRWVDDRTDLLRVRLMVRDLETEAALDLFERIGRLYEEELGEPAAGRLSGQGYLAQVVNRGIVEPFRTGSLWALAAVFAALAVAFRDLRLVAASLPPNLFPLGVVAGLMGWAGIDLRYTSALVLSVVFGLVVDDTIHLVARLRAQPAGEPAPLVRTLVTAGPGMVLSSLVLAAGFAVLLAGEFIPHRVMGGLLVLTVALALAGDLFLLPALLGWWGAVRPRVPAPWADAPYGTDAG
ncbi:MAG: MMPL family transporter [Planctomycetes bacterium]|nr:MMPL family transporter [Planctomycetota bacterium]